MEKNSTGERRKSLTSYQQVNALGKKNLQIISGNEDLDSSLPKKALVNILCLKLNISTSGVVKKQEIPIDIDSSEVENYCKLTPAFIYSVKSTLDWGVDCSCLPDIDDFAVKCYLLSNNVITTDEKRSYKLSRPYQLKEGVHSVRIAQYESFLIVKARCNPSQSTNADDVKCLYTVIDRNTGTPYGGYCTCTAGYILFFRKLCLICGFGFISFVAN